MANNTLAYGFVSLEALLAERVTTVGMGRISEAISESARQHTESINALMSAWVDRNVGNLNTTAKERYYLAGTGTLQPLDQWGNPLPVKEAGYYDVGYPIQGGGTAWGTNRVSRELMTVDYANRQTIEAQKRDADWLKRHILAAIFDNVPWTFTDPELGALTVNPLASGDSTVYALNGLPAATDNHYLAQANAIDNSNNPFDTIRDELLEHPTNTGPLVAYVPTALRASIEALTVFQEPRDANVQTGSGSDVLIGTVDPGVGDEVVGYIKGSGIHIVEWRYLPSTHMIIHARGAGPFVYMREYPVASLQGLFTENHSPDGNLQETRLIRYAGFGVRNRVAAVVQRIGNGTYGIPTGYDAPLAV